MNYFIVKNNNQKLVIFEKKFDFEKKFYDFYKLTFDNRFLRTPLDYYQFRLFWERVYKNGNSTALKRELLKLSI